MKRRNGERGFTLTDLMTGIVVSGIVGAIGLPTASGFMEQYQLVSTANLIGFEVSQARMQAGAQQRFVCLTVRDGAMERRGADPGQTSCAGASEPAAITPLPAGIRVSTSEIRFDPAGLAVVRDTVQLSNSAGARVITTNVLGKVTIS